MDLSSLKKLLRWQGHVRSGTFVAPNFALDVEPGFVAAARLSPHKGQIQSVGARELPAGVLVPSANKSNLPDANLVRRALTEAGERVGISGGKVGLLIPDLAVRAALLQFETLPKNPGEAESLVLWRMREYLPYPPEEARLTFQVVGRQPGGVEILSVAVRNSVIAEYEGLLEGMNGGPALLLPSSAALLPLLSEKPGGQLLLHLCAGSLTAAVVASNSLRYWRTRPLEGDAANNAGEVAREAARVLATCQDSLAVVVEDIWYCARPSPGPELGEALKKALGREVTPLAASLDHSPDLPAGQREAFDDFGLVFAGLMANASQRR